jgi:transposase
MPEREKRRRYDRDFRDGAVRIVRETGKPIRQVAADLGINAKTLGHWVMKDRIARGEKLDPNRVDPERVRQLEKENEELRMERDVLKRSVVLWVKEATQR